jgi:pimeloyl-ACP methyl ester carboxylesterase
MPTTKQTTVLIHGYAFDHRIWYPVELAFEGHHVIYLALPGFGLERVAESYSIESLAKKFWKHLDEVVGGPVNLVGHSMGGYVSIEMVAQQPSMVSSLALVHSHVFADAPEKRSAREETMKNISENGRAGFVNKLIPSLFGDTDQHKEIIGQLISRGLTYDDNAWIFGTRAMLERNDHADTLANINVPVMIVQGEKDKSVTTEAAYKQAALSERTSLVVYPGVGHLAMYENTSALIADLVRFYAEGGI